MCGGCGLNCFEWFWWSFWLDSGRLAGDLRIRRERIERFGPVLGAFWSIPVGLGEISVCGGSGLNGFERFWTHFGAIPVGWRRSQCAEGAV